MSDARIFWYGDNLDVMREHVLDQSVDLIYLDPPFNSQQVYNRFFKEADHSGSDAQRRAFDDYWRWGPEAAKAFDEIVLPRRRHIVPAAFSETLQALRRILHESNMLAYLAMMSVRLIEMRRVMKETASIYLHCDPTASHYLKLLLDALFGQENFRNEIIWKRTGAHNSANRFGPVHDSILYYGKSDAAPCNAVFQGYSAKYLQKFGKVDARTGKNFQDVALTGPGVRNGESGKPWRTYDPTKQNRHWALASSLYKAFNDLTGDDLTAYPLLDRLDLLDKAGMIYWTRNQQPRYKQFLDDAEGVRLQDVWTDIDVVNSQARERTNYPTQKPLALLERIIAASSNEGDIVLDPFCGCGTAVVASQSLNRRWIGIDVTHLAVSVLKARLEERFPGLLYRVRGEPEDVAGARKLADEKWEEFQAWIVDKVGGVPLNPTEEKKVAKKGKDHGLDGLLRFRDDPKAERSQRMILSVKAGKTITPEMIDALFGVMAREGAPMGALLTAYKPSRGVYNEARAYGQYSSSVYAPDEKYDKIQVVTVEDIFSEGWRGLRYPGWNTSRTSTPPVAERDGVQPRTRAKPLRKGRRALPGQQELAVAPVRRK